MKHDTKMTVLCLDTREEDGEEAIRCDGTKRCRTIKYYLKQRGFNYGEMVREEEVERGLLDVLV